MSDKKETSQEAEVGWNTLQSENGQDYRVKATDYDIAEPGPAQDAPAGAGPPFKVDVHWEVGTEGAPSQDIQNKTAITWYKLEDRGFWSVFKYRLTIACEDTYNYKFLDEEPDFYGLNVFNVGGTHYVEYNSKKPTITQIVGN